jgi:hypothetical protein
MAAAPGVRYERTQLGTRMAAATLVCLALAGWVLLRIVSRATLDAVPWMPYALVGTFATAFLLVGWMRVVVDGRQVRAVMGVGLLRKSVPIADIRKVDIVRPRVWWGWGVHWTPAGWLYNVSGRWAIRLELASERPVMIGTGDPEGLLEAIESARADRASTTR